MAITPQSAGTSNILDLQQLQSWAQHTDVTLQELSLAVTKLTNLLTKVIQLNNLKKPK